MKKFLLAGAALSLLAVAAPPARSQSIGTVAIEGNTCPATTQYPVGNNRPLILTQTGILCTSGSGGGGGGGGAITIASGAAVDGWSVTDGSTGDVVCSTDTGVCTEVALFKRMNVGISALVAAIGSSIPAGTADIGVTGVVIGSSTSGQFGDLAQCAVTTSAPTYTTATTNPLSCGTDGTLRVSAPASSPVNVTVTTPPNDVLTGPTSVTGATDVSVSGQGAGAGSLQITGTFTGLAGTIQGSVDGTNYVNIGAYNSNTGAAIASGTSITATGIYVIPAAGYRSLRYHVTAVSTGTAVVNLDASAGSLDPPSSTSGTGRNVNLTGINGVTPVTGNGTTSTGSQRVTIASDQTAFAVKDGDGTNNVTVKAASTQAATTDTALVMSESPLPNTLCTSSIAINQTSSTDLVTSTAKLHICSIILISATSQNISLVEGTGSVCATGIAALMGGTTASIAVAANGGFSSVSDRAWLKSKTTADHVCLLQSGAGNVSGVITYTDAS